MKTLYFISDTHFGSSLSNETPRIALWTSFFKYLQNSNSELYLLGDIFDFWIEYGKKIRPEYNLILKQLKDLVKTGVKVTFIRGNHDFMRGNYLTEKIGLIVVDNDLTIETDSGFSIIIQHGDRLKKSFTSSLRNFLIRSTFTQFIYRLVPSILGVPLAQSVSNFSRNSGSCGEVDHNSIYKDIATTILKERGANLFIMGHTHQVELSNLKFGIFANCGSWLYSNSLIKVEGSCVSFIELNVKNNKIKSKIVKKIKLKEDINCE